MSKINGGKYLFTNVQTLSNATVELILVHVGEIDERFKHFLNDNLTSICKGEYHINDFKYVKSQLREFFEGKKSDENKMMGSVSELYAHLFFKYIGYSNKFVYLNLEENSMKKGFDGYFVKDEEQWILDSKSGNHESQGISHRAKILEAHRSAKKQVTGQSENNPWENAFNHANNGDVRANDSLLKIIRQYSNKYMDEDYVLPNNLNVILASTIFWFDQWQEKLIGSLLETLKDIEQNFEFAKVIMFCCDHKTYEDFMKYLEE